MAMGGMGGMGRRMPGMGTAGLGMGGTANPQLAQMLSQLLSGGQAANFAAGGGTPGMYSGLGMPGQGGASSTRPMGGKGGMGGGAMGAGAGTAPTSPDFDPDEIPF